MKGGRKGMDYQELFCEALENVLKDYEDGKIQFLSEADLKSHLFFECRRLMEEHGFPHPLKLHVEKSVFHKHRKVDLVLGDDEVLVELKLEPDYPGVSKPVVFSTKKEAGKAGGSVEEDLEKIRKYAQEGKHAHFVMIDEDGRHTRRICYGKWRTLYIKNKGKVSYLLHIHEQPYPSS